MSRNNKFYKWLDTFHGGIEEVSKGYNYFGLNVQEDNSIVYREYAPNAVEASLVGEFSMCRMCSVISSMWCSLNL
jgi:1,4-alpha-glucan branching enzyme